MALPEVVPIAHEASYHTATIGRYARGQFFAAIHGAAPMQDGDGPEDDAAPDDAAPDDAAPDDAGDIRWYAYLHRDRKSVV